MTFFLFVAAAVALLLCAALCYSRRAAAAILLLLMLVPLPAAAATLTDLLAAAKPGLLELFGLAITAFVGWAAATARKKWGIDIEARHREALHSALLTGARLALERKLDSKAAIQLILSYVRVSVPDALKDLRPEPRVLEDLAKTKLHEIALSVAPGAADAVLAGARVASALSEIAGPSHGSRIPG